QRVTKGSLAPAVREAGGSARDGTRARRKGAPVGTEHGSEGHGLCSAQTFRAVLLPGRSRRLGPNGAGETPAYLRAIDVKILQQLAAVNEGIEAVKWLLEEKGALASRCSSLTSSQYSLGGSQETSRRGSWASLQDPHDRLDSVSIGSYLDTLADELDEYSQHAADPRSPDAGSFLGHPRGQARSAVAARLPAAGALPAARRAPDQGPAKGRRTSPAAGRAQALGGRAATLLPILPEPRPLASSTARFSRTQPRAWALLPAGEAARGCCVAVTDVAAPSRGVLVASCCPRAPLGE
uniref:Leucine rich adaptor protein 1 n=1 Tax=Crocodylus porosus TaxID=8502 RepID=A0A7M4FLR5_CROPO